MAWPAAEQVEPGDRGRLVGAGTGAQRRPLELLISILEIIAGRPAPADGDDRRGGTSNLSISLTQV